ncbi:30S ribosomal protein S1 [uncultured Eubacterium sp.]|uniref:Tex family protein n=1 Tax=Brotomerdimonas butyrica TaxID=2981721 RepID=UPI000822EE35|nr:Tex family protein [Brotomerdimonas butyrica]MCU6754975.1 RNA-binding transcriptional accessory protein [Brotomerdimonas butyrica]SCH05696.1 30S ribosomal protein S1 [uncultured Eubacterium sp.]
MNIIETIAREFQLRESQVQQTVALIDEGNTIPFIARYRKEATGGLSDVVLRDMDERLTYLRNLQERKDEVIRLIEEQGKLTEELRAQIGEAEVLQRVEDLYKPYKKKKATRASKAREKGLEPLAVIFREQKEESGTPQKFAQPFISEEKGVASADEAIKGACDIIAEMISDDPELTAAIREKTHDAGVIVTEAADPEEKTVYEMYYEYSEGAAKIPNHRILAINRGEKEKKLKVKVQTDAEKMEKILQDAVITNENSIFRPLLEETIADAYKRLMAPAAERELRNMLTERAEAEAVKVFAKNTEKLLMVPPVKGARIISIDPGYRTGCKVAVLNETGKLLAYTTVFPTEPKKDIKGTEAVLGKLVDKFRINTIVIGNGTASRETEEVVADFIKKSGRDISYTIVNEAGASVYSASKLATEEYPDLDVTVRGAMSLGRRLQDPLAELVKIPTKSIGVGQYQHDINQGLLENALDNVVEDCVNRVGVELNTASPSLLAHVAGINMGIASNIVAYREQNGVFKERKELKKVAKLGEKTFNQCAGFIRISGGKNPLDSTSVHPESYKVAEAMLEKLGIEKDDLKKGGIPDIDDRIWSVYGKEEKPAQPKKRAKGLAALAELSAKEEKPKRNMKKAIERMAADLDAGVPTLTDIVAEMKKPGRDPREDAPPVVFRNDVKSFDDLKLDMELEGTVRNVVDFGAFVDIGVKNDGLVHISQMSRKYISHPMDVVSVGDTVKVRIISIDREKQKIGLTMKLK